MARPSKSTPTDGELEILQVLWLEGVCTVRDVHDALVKTRPISYASVSKMVSVMIGKGLLAVVDDRRPQRIRAAVDRKSTQRSITGNLLRMVFGGSVGEMMSHLLGSGDPGDIHQAQKIIDEFKKKNARPRDDKSP